MSNFVVFVGIVGLLIGVLFFNAWLVMLASGAIGHVFEAPNFYISYTQSIIVTIALMIIGSFFRGK